MTSKPKYNPIEEIVKARLEYNPTHHAIAIGLYHELTTHFPDLDFSIGLYTGVVAQKTGTSITDASYPKLDVRQNKRHIGIIYVYHDGIYTHGLNNWQSTELDIIGSTSYESPRMVEELCEAVHKAIELANRHKILNLTHSTPAKLAGIGPDQEDD